MRRRHLAEVSNAMATGFNRLVVGLIARNGEDRKWLIRVIRRHVRTTKDGGEARYVRTRDMRLAFGQYLLCGAHENPAKTIIAPVLALAVYIGVVLYAIFWK